jgi:hypothetical protein
MPRWPNDGLTVSSWEMNLGDMEEIKDIARRVREYLPPSA